VLGIVVHPLLVQDCGDGLRELKMNKDSLLDFGNVMLLFAPCDDNDPVLAICFVRLGKSS
jgi:hypothetical protein